MRYTPIPKRSDTGINFDAYRNMAVQAARANNIKFDPTQFNVIEDHTGQFITVNPQIITSEITADPKHFEVIVSNNSSNAFGKLLVRGGVNARKTNNQTNVTLLTTTNGASEHYEDTAEITGFANNSCYVYLVLNETLIPATLEAKITYDDVYPKDNNEFKKFVLGHCNVNSVSDTFTYEPYYVGGDLIEDTPVLPDSNVLTNRDYSTIEYKPNDGKLQICDTSNTAAETKTLIFKSHYGTAATPTNRYEHTTWVATDFIPRSCGTNVSEAFLAQVQIPVNPANADLINTRGLARADHYHHISDSDHSTNANYATAAGSASTAGSAHTSGTATYVVHVWHHDLDDIVANNAGDDHNGTILVGNYPYIGNRGDYSRNAMASGLGDDDGSASIGVNARQLYDQFTTTSFNWGTRVLYNDVGSAILSFGLTESLDLRTGATPNNWTPTSSFRTTVPLAIIKSTTGDVTIDAKNDMFIYTRDGNLSASIAGNATINPETDNTSSLLIGDGAKDWKTIAEYFNSTYLLKGNGTATIDVPTINIGRSTSRIFYDTQQGQDVTDWFKAGGMIKSGATKLTGAYFFNSNGEIIGPYELVVKA